MTAKSTTTKGRGRKCFYCGKRAGAITCFRLGSVAAHTSVCVYAHNKCFETTRKAHNARLAQIGVPRMNAIRYSIEIEDIALRKRGGLARILPKRAAQKRKVSP